VSSELIHNLCKTCGAADAEVTNDTCVRARRGSHPSAGRTVGVQGSAPLAFLVAGLVLLGSSALGWQVARHRRQAMAVGDHLPGDPAPVP